MGPCQFASGFMRCACPGGAARTQLGTDTSSLQCSLCDHPMADHSGAVPEVATPTPVAPGPADFGADICLREETVTKLAEMVAAKSVVHVRGTPASGKTVLANLLARYYTSHNSPFVLLTGWRGEGDPVEYCVKRYQSKYDTRFNQSNFFSHENITVFIIDEAQESYSDQLFWLSVLKTQSGRGFGPRFCLLSSYGSPSTGVSELEMRSTPLRFGPQQRVSLLPSPVPSTPDIGLFYTESEFLDVVKKHIAIPSRSSYSPHSDARAYLFSVTNGHPAAVTALLDYIYETYRADIKHGLMEEVDKSHVVRALADDAKVLSTLQSCPIGRSFPRRNQLSVQAANTLRQTLVNRSIPFDETDPGIKLCHQMGWLHTDAIDPTAEHAVCVFPSRVHEKFVEINLASDFIRSFPIDQFPTPADLCEHVLKNYSKSQLQQGMHGRVSTSGKQSNPEAQFQDEFYRSFISLVGNGVGISSEWSRDNDGRIHFRVVDPGWGIELLRDGDRLADHCRRFTDTGAYGDWIRGRQLKDWLILDCRHSDPKPTSQAETKLWRVVFKDGYTKALVLDYKNEIIIPEFPLLN